MPGTCAVLNCRGSYKKGLVTLHSFPKDPERRKEWESKVRDKKPNFTATDNSKICSKHFATKCFETSKSGGTWLTQDAVPTIFDYSQKPRRSRKILKESSGSDDESESDSEKKNKPPQKRTTYDDESYTPSSQHKVKRLCYLGDFDEDTVVASPENSQRFFHVAKAEVDGKKRKIRLLRKKNDKLKKRAEKIVNMLKVLKEKHIITDDAS